ncbi:MAG: hypothetical protein ACYS83_10935 [Planctomycetota bacterium]|jgi:hypothetical protein
MKPLMIPLCCVAVLFLLTSCNQEPNVEDYSIEKVEHSLSDGEIESCFDVLGLRFERFKCMIPKRSGITFSSQQYIKGKKRRGESSGTIYADKGLQEFTLFIKQESDSISFSVQTGGSRSSCGSASVEDYSANTWGWIPIKKLSQTEKRPIFFYAANAGGIEGFATDRIDIESLVNKYDFAMVIYVSIEDQH